VRSRLPLADALGELRWGELAASCSRRPAQGPPPGPLVGASGQEGGAAGSPSNRSPSAILAVARRDARRRAPARLESGKAHAAAPRRLAVGRGVEAV